MKDASKILRAVLWVAVSSQAQAKEGDISLDEQERAMRAWCEAQGSVVVDVLSVPGHSRSEEDILTLIDDYRRQGAPTTTQELSPAPVGWVKGRSRKTGKEKESEALPEGQIRQAIGLRGRIAAMPVGSEAGIFAPAAPSDAVCLPGEPYQVVDWDGWRYGQHVQGFSMMGRFPFEIGDWIDFSAFGSDAARRVRILEIRQVTGDTLTDDDLSLLGYGREEWRTEGVPSRRGWLMKVRVEKEIEGKRPTGEPTIIHEDGKVERITPTDSIDD